MQNVDKNFNGIEPITGRPFSGGHPDGIWMLSILLSVIAFMMALLIVFTIFTFTRTGDLDVQILCGALFGLTTALFIVHSAFKRSQVCLKISFFLFLLSIAVLIIQFIASDFQNALYTAINAVFFAVASFYLYGLSKDNYLL